PDARFSPPTLTAVRNPPQSGDANMWRLRAVPSAPNHWHAAPPFALTHMENVATVLPAKASARGGSFTYGAAEPLVPPGRLSALFPSPRGPFVRVAPDPTTAASCPLPVVSGITMPSPAAARVSNRY